MTDANKIFVSVPMAMRNKCAICGKSFEPGEVYSHFNTDLWIPNMVDPNFDWNAWYEAHLDCIYRFFDPERYQETIEPDPPLYLIALDALRETGGFLAIFSVPMGLIALVVLYHIETRAGISPVCLEILVYEILECLINIFESMNDW